MILLYISNVKCSIIFLLFNTLFLTSIYDSLNLHLIAGRYVAQEPNSLLADFVFLVGKQGRKVGKSVAVQHYLSLFVSSGNDVTYGSQGRCLYFNLLVTEQGYQFGYHTAVDHHLDLVVSAVG